MSNNIIFYGERGLVNGIVLDLKDNLALLKKFIASIRFCDGKTPVWVDRILECIYFIEPSFAEFGNPDLMLLCKCKEESIEELCIEEDDNRYKNYEHKENNGSFSFKKEAMTVLSLFPYEESNKQGIMVALRLEYFDESYKKEFPEGPFMFGGGNNRTFIGRFITDIPSEEELQEIQYVIKDYWQSAFN